MIIPVLSTCAVMLAVMIVAWFVQRLTANGGWVDVFWSFGTGICCAGVILFASQQGVLWRRALIGAVTITWSVRLGVYIAGRVMRGSEDVRYAALRREWGADYDRRLLRFVLIQAPVSAILAMAALYAARQPDPGFGAPDGIGLAVAFGAVIGESVADRQMKRFKSSPANKGKVCDRGLWAWSRHPNYFFEALVWLAFPIIGTDPGDGWSFSSWLAPVVMGAALRYGSGVPPLEAAMLRSKGEAYRLYQERVPALVPRRPKKKAVGQVP